MSDGTRGPDFWHHVEVEVQWAENLKRCFHKKLDYWHLVYEMTEQDKEQAVLQAEILILVVVNLMSGTK